MYQLDNRHFLVYDWYGFINGNIINDGVVIYKSKPLGKHYSTYPRLNGNLLSCFRNTRHQNNEGIEIWKFCQINLETVIEENVDVPFVLDDKHSLKSEFVSFSLSLFLSLLE
jgi:hypothetical protein